MPADPADPAQRRCHAQKCPTEVPPEMLMCPRHDALKATAPSGHDKPSAEYLAFAKAAIAEVARQETRQRGRKPRTPKKPVQLALF